MKDNAKKEEESHRMLVLAVHKEKLNECQI